jgi:hypothetical protein
MRASGDCSNLVCGWRSAPTAPEDRRRDRKRAGARARALAFDGKTFDPEKDQVRLGRQLEAVRAAMRGGAWRTLAELAVMVDAPEASVSARIRDLRKPKFGGLRVESRRRAGEDGLWEYCIL